jgi:riboflavin kinase/FMN adenylyltransferase
MDGSFYPSITNVGLNPTFCDVETTSVETHILNFDSDIYKKNIEVFFLSKVRNERKFTNKEELSEQIQKDIVTTKEYFDIK